MPSENSPEPSRAAVPRHSGNSPSRSRLWLWSLIGAVIVAGAVVVLIVTNSNGNSNTADAQVTASPEPTENSPSVTPTAAAHAELAPGDVVVTAGEDGLQLFEAPDDPLPSESLGQWTHLGAPTTLLGFERATVGDNDWIKVELPGAPNHRTAWVREADVEVTSTTSRIDIYLDERELDLTVDGDVMLTNDIVIGAPESPTPLGVFWVTDPLDFTTNPTGAYGAYALGLNGWSETLEEFNGGPPQIAIHGTTQPELMGENVSNGCIRLPNDVVLEVAESAPVGTPVVVHESRNS